jgi:hypothetical protein
LVAVRVYVEVSDGVTWIELPVTAPMPLIESEVAFDVDQETVELWPEPIDAGEAAKEVMRGTARLVFA